MSCANCYKNIKDLAMSTLCGVWLSIGGRIIRIRNDANDGVVPRENKHMYVADHGQVASIESLMKQWHCVGSLISPGGSIFDDIFNSIQFFCYKDTCDGGQWLTSDISSCTSSSIMTKSTTTTTTTTATAKSTTGSTISALITTASSTIRSSFTVLKHSILYSF